MARPLGIVFVRLGQQSLGAFALHVYGILMIAHMPLVRANGFWISTLIQVVLILAIAVLLNATHRVPLRRSAMTGAPARPLAA